MAAVELSGNKVLMLKFIEFLRAQKELTDLYIKYLIESFIADLKFECKQLRS